MAGTVFNFGLETIRFKLIKPVNFTVTVQKNLHYSEAVPIELAIYLNSFQDDVYLTQEPWINNNKFRGLGIKSSTLFAKLTK